MLKKIAILHPASDFGINQYCHELAEGLGQCGVEVDIYSSGAPQLPPASAHRRFCVLGSMLVKQRKRLQRGLEMTPPPAAARGWAAEALRTLPAARPQTRPEAAPGGWKRAARLFWMRHELPLFLKWRGYDAIWTQWPDMSPYGSGLWQEARRLGLRTIHTVHNVLPHEESQDDINLCEPVYRGAEALIVHSAHARGELTRLFPYTAPRILQQWHGSYSMYPMPEGARERVRAELEIGPAQKMVLFCGGIRPYKNIDDSVAALRHAGCGNVVLVVAGQEAHFPDCSPQDPLAHTRALARRFQVEDKVRLIPRSLSLSEMAELFLAGDVALLPYLKGYGSGMLLLAMTFGRFIVSSRTGGAGEYLERYPGHILLEDTNEASIAAALAEAGPASGMPAPEEFHWNTVAGGVLRDLHGLLEDRPRSS
ncbi:MAG: glycosyltransferase family 4 protein [Acidobacteria bacterium]|nr:glycosyltransferase family 4 protein [Acidobacteriota bacterium]